MVEQELTESIHAYYPMIEVSDFVIMPDHLHFILVVHSRIVSPNGRETHLGQVIAGFKKGCNRRYWEITGLTAAEGQGEPAVAGAMAPAGRKEGQGEPAAAGVMAPAGRKEGQGEPAAAGARMAPAGAMMMPEERRTDVETDSLSVVPPQEGKAPSTGNTGRPPLFEYGYVDVMPLQPGQLETQRHYIHNNPRSRLMRTSNRNLQSPQRGDIGTAVAGDGTTPVTGNVAGGLIGFVDSLYNNNSVTATNCANYGAVTGGKYAGGLLGGFNANDGHPSTILLFYNCANYGSLSAPAEGGLTGEIFARFETNVADSPARQYGAVNSFFMTKNFCADNSESTIITNGLVTAADNGYAPASAKRALNVAVEENGYEPWVLGRVGDAVFPELECFMTRAGKTSLVVIIR